jgi:hypothetical protein
VQQGKQKVDTVEVAGRKEERRGKPVEGRRKRVEERGRVKKKVVELQPPKPVVRVKRGRRWARRGKEAG